MGKKDLEQFSRDDKIEGIKESLHTSAQFEIFIRGIHFFFQLKNLLVKGIEGLLWNCSGN